MSVTLKKNYDITEVHKNTEAGELPKAPVNPYRKRPLKMVYDKNEFYTFRLPSEQHFLLSSYDSKDLFGKREGTNHSPHIKAQMDLDTNILWMWFLLTLVALGCEMKYQDEFVPLRENFVSSDFAKLELEDFK